MSKSTKKLGELLVEAGLADKEQIQEALQAQVIFGDRLGTNLIEMGIIEGDHLATFLSKQYDVSRTSRTELESISKQALAVIPARAAYRLGILPLTLEKQNLLLAMINPADLHVVQRVQNRLQMQIECRVITEIELRYYLKKYYGIPREPRYASIIQHLIENDESSKGILLSSQLDRHVSCKEAVKFYFESIKSLDKVPTRKTMNDMTEFDLTSELKFLLLQLDGISTLEEVVGSSPYPRMATLRALVYFATIGIISFETW